MGLILASLGVNPIPLPNPRKGFVSVPEAMCTGRGKIGAGSRALILGQCRNNLSLCYVSNESLAQPEPSL